MSTMEFWEMRLKDFFLKLHFYQGKRQRELEIYSNLVRLQTVALMNIQLQKQDRITDVKKFWLFPWEESGEDKMQKVSEDVAIKLSKLL